MDEFNPIRISLSKSLDIEPIATLIAQESSEREGVERWTELSLWVTPERQYIAQERGKSSIPGERTLYNTAFITGEDRLVRFFGPGRMAKKLLSTINIK